MDQPQYKAFVISNTHWDREWYMSHERYLVRLVELCDRLLDILESQPDYRFVMDGQYAAIADYLAAKPEQTDRVKKCVSNGQLLIGPWYTQPLETIASGEALIRNLSYGHEACQKLGGVMKCSYMIDEFGHASQTPQILNGFSINEAIAWRGMPKNSKSVFNWEAPNGSSVWMFYSNDGYGEATALPSEVDDFDEVIDGKVFPRKGLRTRIENLINHRAHNAMTPNLMWLNGIDHSWAQPDLLDVLKMVQKVNPNVEAKQAIPSEYTDAVRRDYAVNNLQIDTVKGELMYTREDILESTHSNHPRQKRRHYQVEHLLTDYAEPMSVFSDLVGGPDNAYALKRAWTYVLENHAHDSLGCTSVDEVYEQVMARYTCAFDVADQATEGAVRYIMQCGGSEPSVWCFNTSSVPQSGIREMTIILPEGFTPTGKIRLEFHGQLLDTEILSIQRMNDVRYNARLGHPTHTNAFQIHMLVRIPEIPSFGWCRMAIREVPGEYYHIKPTRRMYGLQTESNVLENRFLRVEVQPNGTLHVLDKMNSREYNSQMLFEDDGEAGDSYVHLAPAIKDRILNSSAASAQVATLWDTPLGSAIEISLTMQVPNGLNDAFTMRREETAPLTIHACVSILADDPQLHIHMDIHNEARQHRLRVLFPTHLTDATESVGMQPFDFVARPIHEEIDPEIREQPYPTHPMQGLCSVSDGQHAVSVVAPGVYEYECLDNASRALALTLVRSNNIFGTSMAFSRSPLYALEESQNLCDMSFDVHLLYHKGSVEESLPALLPTLRPMTVRPSRAPENSVMTDTQKPAVILEDVGSIVSTNSPYLQITGLYPAKNANGFFVHVLNTAQETLKGVLTIGNQFGHAYSICETDFAGNEKTAMDLCELQTSFAINPREVKSFLIKRK